MQHPSSQPFTILTDARTQPHKMLHSNAWDLKSKFCSGFAGLGVIEIHKNVSSFLTKTAYIALKTHYNRMSFYFKCRRNKSYLGMLTISLSIYNLKSNFLKFDYGRPYEVPDKDLAITPEEILYDYSIIKACHEFQS